MKPIKNARIPDQIANYAADVAQRQFLRQADVVQQILRLGVFEHQMRESKRQQDK